MVATGLAELDRAVLAVRKGFDYQRFMTPLNYAAENDAFLSEYRRGHRYNPKYTYDSFDADSLGPYNSVLKNAEPDSSGPGVILAQAAASVLREIQMYENLGDDHAFSECSRAVNGVPDVRYKQQALEFLNLEMHADGDDASYSAYDLRENIEERLREYGFPWQINVNPRMAARVSVEPDQRTIYINETKTFSGNDLKRLLVHEIDTHVLRAENGYRRPFGIFASGTAGSLRHEEGLALYNESRNGVRDLFSLKLYGARFLCCLNIELSFYELFDMLMDYGCGEDLAIYVVPRIKRGLSDTSLPGGFIKDYVYLQGLCEVTQAINDDPDLFHKMYYGSISLDDLEVLGSEISEVEETGEVILPLWS